MDDFKIKFADIEYIADKLCINLNDALLKYLEYFAYKKTKVPYCFYSLNKEIVNYLDKQFINIKINLDSRIPIFRTLLEKLEIIKEVQSNTIDEVKQIQEQINNTDKPIFIINVVNPDIDYKILNLTGNNLIFLINVDNKYEYRTNLIYSYLYNINTRIIINNSKDMNKWLNANRWI